MDTKKKHHDEFVDSLSDQIKFFGRRNQQLEEFVGCQKQRN